MSETKALNTERLKMSAEASAELSALLAENALLRKQLDEAIELLTYEKEWSDAMGKIDEFYLRVADFLSRIGK